jgi:hypothetical protein
MKHLLTKMWASKWNFLFWTIVSTIYMVVGYQIGYKRGYDQGQADICEMLIKALEPLTAPPSDSTPPR